MDCAGTVSVPFGDIGSSNYVCMAHPIAPRKVSVPFRDIGSSNQFSGFLRLLLDVSVPFGDIGSSNVDIINMGRCDGK